MQVSIILIGGLAVSGGTISGTEVMILQHLRSSFTRRSTIHATSTVDLSAQATGLYPGVLFFQDPDVPSGLTPNVFEGTGAMNLTGTPVLPHVPPWRSDRAA